MFEPNLPPGAVRQRSSGALIFPVHPQEAVREKKMEELDKELAEVRKLKEELIELKDSLTPDEQ